MKMQNNRNNTKGFTLMELIVVIAIIMIVVGGMVNITSDMLASNEEGQVYTMFSGYLSSARARAIEKQDYVGLCVETTDATPPETWISIIDYDGTKFTGSKGKKLPGSFAFGQIDSTSISGDTVKVSSSTQLKDFTRFIIVFSPEGKLVRKIARQNIQFTAPVTGAVITEEGTNAVTMFNYGEASMKVGTELSGYLDENSEFMIININTGLLFPRV